jgi:adenine phosphoribosyltransferase
VVDLLIVANKPAFSIALMMLINVGVGFVAHAGARLAAHFAAMRPDIVVRPATRYPLHSIPAATRAPYLIS